jgi:hypothetical protein
MSDSYKNVTPYNCCLCGEHEEAHYVGNKRMVDAKLCFTCNFWDELTTQASKTIRIEGTHYMNGPNAKKPHKYNGFAGRKFTIKMNSGEIIETCDLWYQGEIPTRFRDKMPDNATFVHVPEPVGHGQGFLG